MGPWGTPKNRDRKSDENGAKKPEGKRGKGRQHDLRMIEDAIELATRLHKGQTDKYHLPYIMHVFGVAARCRTIEEKIVAFLHDTVEDGHITFDELRERGYTERVLAAVDCLTRRRGESYGDFVDRIAPNSLARAVKLADLEDNMDVRRSNRSMKPKDVERFEKYRLAWQKLAVLAD